MPVAVARFFEAESFGTDLMHNEDSSSSEWSCFLFSMLPPNAANLARNVSVHPSDVWCCKVLCDAPPGTQVTHSKLGSHMRSNAFDDAVLSEPLEAHRRLSMEVPAESKLLTFTNDIYMQVQGCDFTELDLANLNGVVPPELMDPDVVPNMKVGPIRLTMFFRRCSLTAVLRIFTEDVRAKILEQEREIIVKNAKSVTTQVVSGFLMRALQD